MTATSESRQPITPTPSPAGWSGSPGAQVSTTTAHPDTIAINTIRTLCMDAIQRANSGHPGTPMGVAPVAYTLWQRFLRFDPADPIWPNRDRFVLSEGHASALLWSLLHLSGVRAVDPDYEMLNRAVNYSRRPQDVSSARLALPRPSRVPLDKRRGDDHRAAWARGWRPRWAWRSPGAGWRTRYNRDELDIVRFRRLCPGRRRLHDGGHLRRGRVVGWSSRAGESVLDLRLQPRDDRGPHRHHVHRGCRGALRGLRLERHHRRRRQRHRLDRSSAAHIQGRAEPGRP